MSSAIIFCMEIFCLLHPLSANKTDDVKILEKSQFHVCQDQCLWEANKLCTADLFRTQHAKIFRIYIYKYRRNIRNEIFIVHMFADYKTRSFSFRPEFCLQKLLLKAFLRISSHNGANDFAKYCKSSGLFKPVFETKQNIWHFCSLQL